MRLSLLPYNRQTLGQWSLVLVIIVLTVCFSQNFSFFSSCSLTSHAETTEQLQQQSTSQIPNDEVSQCNNSEHLFNTYTVHLDFAIPMFILALLIIAAILKQSGTTYLFTKPMTSYGIRRHLAFCTFQE